jgi:hypothetical protein
LVRDDSEALQLVEKNVVFCDLECPMTLHNPLERSKIKKLTGKLMGPADSFHQGSRKNFKERQKQTTILKSNQSMKVIAANSRLKKFYPVTCPHLAKRLVKNTATPRI